MARLSNSAVLAAEILRKWPDGLAAEDTREQERLDALEAVIEELRREDPGRDRMAACTYLLKHLSKLSPSVS